MIISYENKFSMKKVGKHCLRELTAQSDHVSQCIKCWVIIITTHFINNKQHFKSISTLYNLDDLMLSFFLHNYATLSSVWYTYPCSKHSLEYNTDNIVSLKLYFCSLNVF